MNNYTDINSGFFDKWVAEGWEWGTPISHEVFEKAKHGDWNMVLTPTKPVPKDWFCTLKGAKVLGLASGGGQQMPVFAALGAKCTILDYSDAQLESERLIAKRENYDIEIIKADMTKPLPLASDSFDLIFHPVSNCYIEDVQPVWNECYRILKKGGILLAGLDNGIGFAFNDDETALKYKLPFNPLKNKQMYDDCFNNNWGLQFLHTLDEQIGGQLKAGFILKDIYQDSSGSGNLHEYNMPTFMATKSVK